MIRQRAKMGMVKKYKGGAIKKMNKGGAIKKMNKGGKLKMNKGGVAMTVAAAKELLIKNGFTVTKKKK